MKQKSKLTSFQRSLAEAYLYEGKSITYLRKFVPRAGVIPVHTFRNIIQMFLEEINADDAKKFLSDFEEKALKRETVHSFRDLIKNDDSITIRDAYPHYFKASKTPRKPWNKQPLPAYMGV